VIDISGKTLSFFLAAFFANCACLPRKKLELPPHQADSATAAQTARVDCRGG
jgi:hypothetical protein